MAGAPISAIDSLPEDCILDVISLTSPRDAYNFSLASTGFRSVVDSDFIWQSFLPSDYACILSRAVDPVMYSSKKDLFFKLSDHHVLIDGGKMSFGLERSSGAKCYMISAGELEIAFADDESSYWRWISLPDSRFLEVAEPITRCQLDIIGKIDSKTLSPKTRYGAYLIYKLTDGSSWNPVGQVRQHASVTVGKYVSKSTVFLEPSFSKYVEKLFSEWKLTPEEMEFNDNITTTNKERGDGWMEVMLGSFYNDNGEDGDVKMELREVCGLHWKGGLIIQGIEIKPS